MKRKTPEELAEEINKLEATMSTSSGGSHILKLKKEAVAADGLWKEMMRRDVPEGGGMERWLRAMKQRMKKLVKRLMTPMFIESLRARGPHPRTWPRISAEKLSRKCEIYRQEYLAREYIDGKWAHYQNALVEQYDRLGYAKDEDE